jgi:TRAP transporter TAXI family solute receptor
MEQIRPAAIKRYLKQPLVRLRTISWRDLITVLLPILAFTLALGWLAVKLIRPAPPDRVVILSGPEDGSYHSAAQRYAKAIEAHGIKVDVRITDGSVDNLKMLLDKKQAVDVGFVQTGLADDDQAPGLMSLGTIYVQPVMVFYRGARRLELLTQLKGKRVAIGPDGSGTAVIAQKMFEENGMDKQDVKLIEIDGEDAIAALLAHQVDAVFATGEQVRGKQVRELMRKPGIKLMNFRQADGYRRRLKFLSRLVAPEGSFDLGRNLPPQDVELVGTPVELIARDGLHPAISDLLIAAARDVHGKPGMYRKGGEYPAAIEHDIPLSEEARRYYTSGSPFLYKRLPFWLASLVDRILIVVLPLLIVVVPASRMVAPLYRWRMRSRIYRWYGALMTLEREMLAQPDEQERPRMRRQLEDIEHAVNGLQLPLAFADQLYVLREHIGMVRARFEALSATAGDAAPATV